MPRCCLESEKIVEVKELEEINCITQYSMFEAAILTTLTLDIAYRQFCQEARERSWKVNSLHKENRYM